MKNYTIENVDNKHIVYIEGNITFRDHDTFFEIISDIKNNKKTTYVINLKDCDFIDSAGLGMLVIAHDEATARQNDMILQGARGKLSEILYCARFDTLYKFDDIEWPRR